MIERILPASVACVAVRGDDPDAWLYPEEMAALGFDPELVARVDRMIATSEFKRQVPPIAKLGPRTAGVDYLYPRRRPGSARR